MRKRHIGNLLKIGGRKDQGGRNEMEKKNDRFDEL